MKSTKKEKVLVIVSGGMDSVTLLHWVKSQGFDVMALSFDYKQKHRKELAMAQLNCSTLDIPHKILDLSILNDIAPSSLTRDEWDVPEGHYADENMKQTVVPNRNMVMLSLAVSYGISNDCTAVYYGAHSGDHDIYPDCRKEFIYALNDAVKLADWKPIELRAPFIAMDKYDILLVGEKIGVNYRHTWTCYKGREKACGKCGSCTERLEAFEKLGIDDPLKYE